MTVEKVRQGALDLIVRAASWVRDVGRDTEVFFWIDGTEYEIVETNVLADRVDLDLEPRPAWADTISRPDSQSVGVREREDQPSGLMRPGDWVQDKVYDRTIKLVEVTDLVVLCRTREGESIARRFDQIEALEKETSE